MQQSLLSENRLKVQTAEVQGEICVFLFGRFVLLSGGPLSSDIHSISNQTQHRAHIHTYTRTQMHTSPYRHVLYPFRVALTLSMCCFAVVDPPRAGLDATTRTLVTRYSHLLYISCNPDALERDMEELSQTVCREANRTICSFCMRDVPCVAAHLNTTAFMSVYVKNASSEHIRHVDYLCCAGT